MYISPATDSSLKSVKIFTIGGIASRPRHKGPTLIMSFPCLTCVYIVLMGVFST